MASSPLCPGLSFRYTYLAANADAKIIEAGHERRNFSLSIDLEHVVVTDAVVGSPFPVDLMYVEMVDDAYIPVGMRKPTGGGPFPLVLFATGNGGGGMTMLLRRSLAPLPLQWPAIPALRTASAGGCDLACQNP